MNYKSGGSDRFKEMVQECADSLCAWLTRIVRESARIVRESARIVSEIARIVRDLADEMNS